MPGQIAKNVDKAARDVIEKAGFGEYFIHRTGHGLGSEIHEPPFITSTSETILEPGMVFSIEPGIYIPENTEGVPEETKGIGIRIEDNILVTPTGYENMTTKAPKEIDELESIVGQK